MESANGRSLKRALFVLSRICNRGMNEVLWTEPSHQIMWYCWGWSWWRAPMPGLWSEHCLSGNTLSSLLALHHLFIRVSVARVLLRDFESSIVCPATHCLHFKWQVIIQVSVTKGTGIQEKLWSLSLLQMSSFQIKPTGWIQSKV